MVGGAAGHMENGAERLVKTCSGTKKNSVYKGGRNRDEKVIHDHSTIRIVVTTDGSIGELPRNSYRAAEKKTIQELKSIGKPFVVLVNTGNRTAQRQKTWQKKSRKNIR